MLWRCMHWGWPASCCDRWSQPASVSLHASIHWSEPQTPVASSGCSRSCGDTCLAGDSTTLFNTRSFLSGLRSVSEGRCPVHLHTTWDSALAPRHLREIPEGPCDSSHAVETVAPLHEVQAVAAHADLQSLARDDVQAAVEVTHANPNGPPLGTPAAGPHESVSADLMTLLELLRNFSAKWEARCCRCQTPRSCTSGSSVEQARQPGRASPSLLYGTACPRPR
jgi:hypothetical protein